MRETRWPAARGRSGLLIDRTRLQARALDGLGQTLISGDLDAAIAALAPGAPTLGLHAIAPQGAHALRIGRASALLVEVSGADAAQALMQATSVDLAGGSPSAAVLFFGLRGLLARIESGFRVHVEAPWLETLLAWLDGASEA